MPSEKNWKQFCAGYSREELKAVPSQPIPQQEEAIPKEMMGFLGSLLREE